jgi:hypothetical protein
MRNSLVLVVVAALLPAVNAAAQTDRPVGFTLGYPAQVGVLWHINDRIAIRPDVGFSTSESEIETELVLTILPGGSITRTSTAHSDTSSVTARVSLLLTIKSWEGVALYVTPSYGYNRGTSSITTTVDIGIGAPETTVLETTSHGHSGAGSLGVQFTPHERFAIFAETGLRYSSSHGDLSSGTRSTGHAFGTSGTIGAVVYF